MYYVSTCHLVLKYHLTHLNNDIIELVWIIYIFVPEIYSSVIRFRLNNLNYHSSLFILMCSIPKGPFYEYYYSLCPKIFSLSYTSNRKSLQFLVFVSTISAIQPFKMKQNKNPLYKNKYVFCCYTESTLHRKYLFLGSFTFTSIYMFYPYHHIS